MSEGQINAKNMIEAKRLYATGITQTEVAKQMGITQAVVSRLVNMEDVTKVVEVRQPEPSKCYKKEITCGERYQEESITYKVEVDLPKTEPKRTLWQRLFKKK